MSEQNFESEGVYSKNIVEFVTVAHEYCKFIEQSAEMTKSAFVDTSQKLLPLLYLKVSLLTAEETGDEFLEKFVSELDWSIIKERISAKLGTHDNFIEIIRPDTFTSLDTESVSLSECFSDIYQDMKDFTTLYQIGSPDAINAALWDCVQNFRQYWGGRLLSVLNELHLLLFNNEDLEDEIQGDKIDNPENSEFDFS